MPGVHIVCDSTADLDPVFRAAHAVSVVPLKVIFGEEVLEDGVDIDPIGFYARMRASTVHPRTSQPTPGEFVSVFREVGADGDPIVCTTISAGLSGTYASAIQARAELADRDIRVIDTLSVAIGHQAMVREALRVAESGGSADEVERAITSVRATIRILFTVETLEYLRRGGRIGGARAFLGSVLDIKPILALREGVIEPVDRVRTYPRALERMVEGAVRAAQEWGGVAIGLAHADRLEVAQRLAQRLREATGAEPVLAEVGPVIGCHCGPGGIGVCFYRPLS
jgi:DegV family protein with EDD domain